MKAEQSLRKHLTELLRGGSAHARVEEVLADWPPQLRGQKPAELPYSPWRILEHMRIAQWDILEFSRNAQHVSPDFPGGYWPQQDAPPGATARCSPTHSVAKLVTVVFAPEAQNPLHVRSKLGLRG